MHDLVRQWRADFVSNGGEFSEYPRGKYQRYVILEDEEYKEMALHESEPTTTLKGVQT